MDVFFGQKNILYLPSQGEMAEWSNAAVLKTVEGHTSGGFESLFLRLTALKSQCFRGFFFLVA